MGTPCQPQRPFNRPGCAGRRPPRAIAPWARPVLLTALLVAGGFACLSSRSAGAEVETVEVVNTSDSGAGSLRAAIDYANAHPGTQVVFHIPLIDSGYADGVFTIRPTSALPVLSATSASLDGSTQTAFTGDTNPVGPEVVLNGALAGSATSGIEITGSACLIRAFVVNGFAHSGVLVSSGPGGHRIEGCYIGTDPTGMVAVPNGGGVDYQAGVCVNSGTGTVVGGTSPGAGNLLSGNGTATTQGDGIGLYWATTVGTRIEGNRIGTDRTGSGALGNSRFGVTLYRCGADTVVGGDSAGARNVISGNQQSGVLIAEVTAAGTVVAANYIGTDHTGTLRLANLKHGIELWASRGVTIGGATAERRNLVSGNYWHGVFLSGSDATGNSVIGNYVGTDVTGTTAIPNSWVQATSGGVYIGSAVGNRIGGAAPGEGNLISGNAVYGVILDWADDNDVQGNRVGTNAAGTGAVPNQSVGVYIPNGSYNRVGGTAPGMRNLISGNTGTGVYIEKGGGSTVQGNWIGVDFTGVAALGNSDDGVRITLDSCNNLIGGTEPGAGNVIRYNAADGVGIANAGYANRLLGNAISGNGALGIDLGEDGVTANDAGDGDSGPNLKQNYPVLQAAFAGAAAILVFGTLDTPGPETCRLEFFASDTADPSGYGEGQTYLGSGAAGVNGRFVVSLNAAVSAGAWITATATDALDNTSEFSLALAALADNDPDADGLTNAQEHVIGSDANNPLSGPEVVFTSADSGAGSLRAVLGYANAHPGSTIRFALATSDSGYDAATGAFTLRPASALPAISGAGTAIDGTTQAAFGGNSNPSGPEIVINGAAAPVDASGLTVSAANCRLAGLAINGFGAHGICIAGPAAATVVRGCYLGTDARGSAAVANGGDGVRVTDSPGNRIGGTAAGDRNLISGNAGCGVAVRGEQGLNSILGNTIGLTAARNDALPNGGDGVALSSPGNSVGGSAPGAANLISGNAGCGVFVSGPAATGNRVEANSIYDNSGIGIDLAAGSSADGVTANDAGDTDSGPNALTNSPAIQMVYAGAGTLAVCGQLDTPSAETCRLEVFSNDVRDPSGYGEGQTYLGSGAPTADGVFAVTLSATVSVGTWVTVTATDAAGNTSEFGLCVAASATDGDSLPDAWEWRYWQNLDQAPTDDPDVDGFTNAQELAMGTDPTLATSGPGTLLFGAAASSVAEAAGAAEVPVMLSSAVAQTVTVQYTTGDGSATAGSDYAASSGTLSFAPGQTTQTITVPVTDDMLYEGSETLTVTLANPTHAALGLPSSHTLTILDDENVCTVTTTANSGAGSLRAAIDYANAHPRTQVMFQIPLSDSGYANGVFTIQPTAALPVLSATAANLDGGTQTAFTGDTNPVGPEVVLNGALAGSAANGIVITGSGCLVRALVVNGFADNGLTVAGGPGGHRIEACYIGTDPTGTLAVPNARGSDYHSGVGIHGATGTVVGGTSPGAGNLISGNGTDTFQGSGVTVSNMEVSGTRIEGNLIGTDRTGTVALGNSRFGVVLYLCGANNVVGGEVAAARNVISGNRQSGVAVGEATAAGTVVSGNYIGTDLTGTLRLANLQHGVDLWNSRGVTIGGTTPGQRNLISGNAMSGVYFRTYGGGPTGDTIIGNYIGTDASGTAALGNGGSGVRIVPDASGNIVGGTDPGTGNRIAFNTAAGVALESGTGNAVLGNAIFSNGLLGIDLGPTGVTANDAGDSDAGRNNQQNFPLIQAAFAGSGTTVVLGTLDTPSPQTCRLEVFASDVRDPSGYGEGQTYLGSGVPTAGGSFVVTLNAAVTVGTWVTATATDAVGNTSEFSRAVAVVDDDDPDGDGLTNGQEQAIGSDPNDPLSGLEVVFTSADAGAGSLRAALAYANAHPGTTIRFAIPTSDSGYAAGTGTFAIRPASPLPAIAGAGTAIDGTTQAAFGGDTNPLGPEVVISGAAAPADTSGFTVGAANCQLAGLAINGFGAHGIRIDSAGNLIGGSAVGDPNRIFGNAGCGVLVSGAAATGNRIGANSIYGNGGLGIDLAAGSSADGVTANDAGDADPGPNGLQNSPVLQAAYAGPSTLAVCGQLDTPNAGTCRLEVFSNAVQDPSGYGEGQTYLGSGAPTADGIFAVTLSATVSVGTWLTATATDAAGNTSEFALALAATASDGDALPDAWEWRYWQNLDQAPTDDPDVDGFSNAQELAMGTDPTLATSGPDALYLAAVSSAVAESAGTATLAVQLSNAVAQTVTVHYATSDGRATAGSDYSATSGTLSFAPGQTLQTITVPVTDDMLYEGDETLSVTLSNPVRAALGTASQTLTILDDEDVYTVTTTADSGAGSLRAAIDYANAHPRTQVMFQIPLSDSGYENGVHTIQPLSALPALSATAANLDGGTQTAFSGDTNPVGPEVVLNGTLAGSLANGIEIFGSRCLIRALVVNGFAYNGVVVVAGPGGHRIEACYIGTDPTGMLAVPNVRGQNYQAGVNICSGMGTVIGGTRPGDGNLLSGNGTDTFQGDGIVLYWAETTGTRIEGNLIGTDRTGTGALGNSQYGVALYMCGADNVIGGEGAAARNVISGNWQHGVGAGKVSAAGTVIAGNYVGTDRTGTLRLANRYYGVELWDSSGVTVGGTSAARRNLISGNAMHGVALHSGATDNAIIGNYIGTDVSGRLPLPNTYHGILVQAASSNSIGGSAAGAGNHIAFNTAAGIAVESGTGNAVRGNSIVGNGLLGLDLGSSGVTANDIGDGDTGANNLQNFPVIQAAYAGATEIEISGTLDTPNRQTCTLDFFSGEARDASGYGEGQTYLGSGTPLVDGTFAVTLGATASIGPWVTATATDASGNTSEFALGIAVTLLDVDADGLADEWEQLIFAGDADPFDDPDHDGFNNLCEFRDGTNPLDKASFGTERYVDPTSGHAYRFYAGTLACDQAQDDCAYQGGHLATVANDAENTVVYSQIAAGVANAWIGGILDHPGTWRWVTGEAWSFSKWRSGEPLAGSARDYTGMGGPAGLAANQRKWSALTNSSATVTGYVCEWDYPGDVDSDALADAWEMRYFGNLLADPGDDPDRDGLTNLQEQALGSNPVQWDPTYTVSGTAPGGELAGTGAVLANRSAHLVATPDPSPYTYAVAQWLRVLPDNQTLLLQTGGASYDTPPLTADLELRVTFACVGGAPTPTPLAWQVSPQRTATGWSAITMSAVTATHPLGVDYKFDLVGPGTPRSSGWIATPEYEFSGLPPDTLCTFEARARNRDGDQVATQPTPPAQARTGVPPAPTLEILEPDGIADFPDRNLDFTITWRANSELQATVTFYLDNDNAGFPTSSQVPTSIPPFLPAASGDLQSTALSVLGYAEGKYYIWGVLNDGYHPPVRVYSPGPFLITRQTISDVTCQLLTAPSLVYGHSAHLRATIQPTVSGWVVFVFRPLDTDGVPTGVPIEVDPVLSSGLTGVAETRWPRGATGEWEAYAYWPGNTLYSPARSATVRFSVTPASAQVELVIPRPTLALGRREVGGLLSLVGGNEGASLAGASVQLTVQNPAGGLQTLVAACSATGQFSVPVDFTETGLWQVRAEFPGTPDLQAAAPTAWKQISIVQQTTYLILCQGSYPVANPEGRDAHAQTLATIYAKSREVGLDAESINYLTFWDAAAAPERDGTPSLAALETAITGWASARMNAAPAPLYIVLVNHGSIGAFHIGRDLLIPTALDRMLDTLQDVKLTDPVARQQQVVVVLGSCHSGSFIRTLSANKRIVIAAADTWESSYRGASQAGELNPDGEYFVSTLFHELTRTDNSLFAAFQVAAAAARERAICTTPVAPPSGPLWIQDNLRFQHCVSYVIANGDDTYTYRFTSASWGGVPRPLTHIVFELPTGVSLLGLPSSQYNHAWSVGPDAATGVSGVKFLAGTYRLGAQPVPEENEWFQFTVGKFVEKVTIGVRVDTATAIAYLPVPVAFYDAEAVAQGGYANNITAIDNSQQHPLLDDDGNRLGSHTLTASSGDGTKAQQVYFGTQRNAAGDLALLQVNASLCLAPSDPAPDLWAEYSRPAGVIAAAWIEVKPPNFAGATPAQTMQYDMNLTPLYATSLSTAAATQQTRAAWTPDTRGSDYNPAVLAGAGLHQVLYYGQLSGADDAVSGRSSWVFRASGLATPATFALLTPAADETIVAPAAFTWEPSPSEAGPVQYLFRLWRDGDQTTLYYEAPLAGLPVAVLDHDLLPNGEYWWEVIAVDPGGNTRRSELRHVLVNTPNSGAISMLLVTVYDRATLLPVPGATLTINGAAPLSVASGGYPRSLAPGSYTLRVSAGVQYAEQTRQVNLAGGAHSEAFALQATGTQVTLNLQRGWNLISLPIQPYDPAVATVLQISGTDTPAYRVVYGWNGATFYPVTTLDALHGYWVFCPEDCRVEVRGQVVQPARLNLAAGWQLVGASTYWPWYESRPSADKCLGWTGTAYRTLGAQPQPDTERMRPGAGYWLYLDAPAEVQLGP